MLVIAHRGASAHAPENTLAAFRRAVEMGAAAVELDVHEGRDGTLFVAHDDDLRRCGGGDKRRLEALRARDAASIDVGSWFSAAFAAERLPMLDEIFALLPRRVEVHVELKHGSRVYPAIEKAALDLVERHQSLDRVVFSSFDHAALRLLRAQEPEARLGYLKGLAPLSAALKEMQSLRAESLHLSLRQASPRAVKAAKALGFKVYVYTVNKAADRDRLERMGVDGIFSNHPELAR